MDRAEEIKIIISYLKKDLLSYYESYPKLVNEKIIEYGVLIEKYKNELKEIDI